MSTIKKYISDQRMLKLIEVLKTSGQIRFNQTFLDAIDMPKQNIRFVKIGEKHFTPEHIQMACKTYKVNANWIFGFEKEIFRTPINVVKKK